MPAPTPTLSTRKPTGAPTSVDATAPMFPAPVGARSPGISIYDYVAAVAMQGLLTHGMKINADRAMTEAEMDQQMAERAYRIAGAMLRARAATIEEQEKQSAIPTS